ncbi:RNase P modulator RnpM [Alkalibacillus aidingensis]|uniref:RNase P modulator RnpM n=1 Tax=Alkalibacillus aidingensis TaxID=2747607 RepID=UPI0016610FDB|nr:YlxR family protein [Alkalibacillus aidingensis]
MANKKKEPLRKCVVTQEMFPKKELIRVVRNKEGEVFIDETGKKNGRGAYLKKDRTVIEQAKKKNVLKRQLNAAITDELYDELLSKVGE